MALGQPPKLTPQAMLDICEAISHGCYYTTAAQRVGISPFTLYVWRERGRREVEARDLRRIHGEPGDEPMSRYEEFALMLASAQASARYSAETRVFQTMPLAWLKNGYARRDWRESGTVATVVESTEEQRLAGLSNADFGIGVPRAKQSTESERRS
jgi:hypothetical protein